MVSAVAHLQAGVGRRRVLEDEGVELVVELQRAVVAARLAALRDGVALRRHDQLRLGVVALGAQHELADEPARPRNTTHRSLERDTQNIRNKLEFSRSSQDVISVNKV